MFKLLIVLILFQAPHGTNAKDDQLYLDNTIFHQKNMKFLFHTGESPFANYVTLGLKFNPIFSLFQQLSQVEKRILKNRGEAHITIITPVEYFNILKQKISIKEIAEIINHYQLDMLDMEIICLGSQTLKINHIIEKTFYVVIKSKALIEMRKEIFQLYLNKSGKNSTFDPENYHPHITIGFSERDLYLSDGAIKDEQSCKYEISVSDPIFLAK